MTVVAEATEAGLGDALVGDTLPDLSSIGPGRELEGRRAAELFTQGTPADGLLARTTSAYVGPRRDLGSDATEGPTLTVAGLALSVGLCLPCGLNTPCPLRSPRALGQFDAAAMTCCRQPVSFAAFGGTISTPGDEALSDGLPCGLETL